MPALKKLGEDLGVSLDNGLEGVASGVIAPKQDTSAEDGQVEDVEQEVAD